MKQTFFSLSLILLLFGCSEKSGYEIIGKIAEDRTDVNGKQVYLYNADENVPPIDSALIENNAFRFVGNTATGKLYLISFEESEIPSYGLSPAYAAYVVMEPGKTNVVLDTLSSASGTVENDLFKSIQQQLVEKEKEYSSLIAKVRSEDSTMINEATVRMKEVIAESSEMVKNYITENPSKLSAAKLFKNYHSLYNEEEKEAIISKTDSTFKSFPGIDNFVKQFEIIKKTAVGQPFIDFEMADQNGKMKRLSDYIGKDKYVFLDFWASWCGPCIRELPHVSASYAKYKKKAFEIVAVSLDEDKEKWLGAIKDHKMEWIHLSDLKGWSCEGAQLYGVRSIPTTLLIDKDGIIIDKNLRGDALEKRLAELLD